MTGAIETTAGKVPQISDRLSVKDLWGTFKVRCNISRMDYKIDPGLYALGHPDNKSPVLVTANYKLSFDHLRKALPEQNMWILVLDTKGINVWCAAGKGTFGTEELINRIESSGLSELVSHRELILPQLAGPGVAAHQVKKLSGFEVIYGPIRATDLPAFIKKGFRATPEMRKKTFTVWERAVLIPVEFVSAFKWFLIISPILFILGGLGGEGGFWTSALKHGLFAVIALFGSLMAGAVFTPLLLPWLPGRAFSLKGLWLGLIWAGILMVFQYHELELLKGHLALLSWFLILPAVAAYLAMNFTGASTYTSLSGVKKEMRWAVPLEIGAAGAGLSIWLGLLIA